MPNLSSFNFDYTHIVKEIVSCFYMIAVFPVIVQMWAEESVEIPRDVIQQIVLEAIQEHDLPPSGGKEFVPLILKATQTRRQKCGV
jgi:hypothetical protein